MKIWGKCRQCYTLKDGAPDVFVEMNEELFAVATCEHGHKTLLIYQSQLFQFLFDSGAMAFLDSYRREAVTSFIAALERFHEFALRVMLHHARRSDLIDDVWSPMARQSERQLGAYIALYAVVVGKKAPQIPKRLVEFRNDVVHYGHFPSEADTLKFGDAVLDVVRSVLADLRALDKDVLLAEIAASMARALEAAPKDLGQPLGMGPKSIITLDEGEPVPTLTDGLREMKVWRDANYRK